jgi:hypothetical protein
MMSGEVSLHCIALKDSQRLVGIFGPSELYAAPSFAKLRERSAGSGC